MPNNKKIHDFINRWTGKGYEKGQSQMFWIELLTDVLGVETPSEIISFEDQVKLDHTSFIDAYIRSTHVMIEQKSIEKDLRGSIKQSDGSFLTPFQQAKRYASELPYSLRPRWIVTCNFRSFLIYDMENPQGEPFEILLENLEKEAHELHFLVDVETHGRASLQHEMEVSIQAGEIVGRLYDAFLAQYQGEATAEDLHSLNVLCVRLVFCLYAEDAGVFDKDQFVNYLRTFTPDNMRLAIMKLFETLDTPIAQRDKFLESKLKAFPYVNGSLFRQQPGEVVPPITDSTADLLIHHASLDFNWSDISPTIFGAVFESTLNPETRRTGGMHYTSIENIHKVIDPLFMDDLNEEFDALMAMPKGKQRTQQLETFQERLAGLTFLDPACGSGNFLTETYVSLRRLENKVILELVGGQALMGFEEVNPIKVHIQQFYGIEINDFAATVAKTALWIAEAQMMNETERIIQFTNDYLPLKTYDNITEGNALRIDWNEVVPASELDYIIGNPPFVGYSLQSKGQKEDMLNTLIDNNLKPYKYAGKIDYVSGWYYKACQMMQANNAIKTALVSTNSITQGEQVAGLWKPLLQQFNLHIDFAYPTFRWDSESSQMAHVHCVIIGFSIGTNEHPRLYQKDGIVKECKNVNAYLNDAPNVFIESRNKPLCNIPTMLSGNRPSDGGFLLLEPSEKEDLVKHNPLAERYIKTFMMGYEFINNVERYCLWLVNASPKDLREMPLVMERVAKCREVRLESPDAGRRRLADTPHLFREQLNPLSFIALPKVSSENRRYIPMGYLGDNVIAGDKLFVIPDATLYHFGVLTSNVHMAWMRAVCGRLEMRYSYSINIVYNNFPWPTPTDDQRQRIEQTAQGILDARNLYPDCSLADLYDEVTMPPELRRAHQENDRAVMAAYGFPVKNFTESDCVAELFKMYKELTK